MEDIMTDRFHPHETSREDLLIQSKWARTLAVVYGAALLLLVALVAATRMLAEPKAARGVAIAPAPQVAERAPATMPRRRN
jgi:hypothetical protein